MIAQIQSLGRIGLDFCQRVGRSGLFLLGVVLQPPKWRQAWPLFAEQIYRVGILSLVIILLST